MSELVTNCPRCSTKKITFDVHYSLPLSNNDPSDDRDLYEIFGECRNCGTSTVFVVSRRSSDNTLSTRDLSEIESLNDYVCIEGFVTIKDQFKKKAPDHLPEKILSIFNEGSTCLSVGCYNAAGSMFRLCIDFATQELLPEEDIKSLNSKTRYSLSLRINWLFEKGYLTSTLKTLAACIRQDGNDGAHAGTLGKVDAEDLLDFSKELLERIFTGPKKLSLANDRRQKRRDENT